ncbi:unnamed protein product [Absidia cylindrospora]
MVKFSISEGRLPILPQRNNCIPLEATQYTGDHPTTTLPLYSNLQYPYSMIDTQQQVRTTDQPQQTISTSTDFLPHLLMLQPSTSQQVDSNSNRTYSNDTHENTLITPKEYSEYSDNNNTNNAPIQDTTTTSIYTINTNNFWQPQSLQSLDKPNLISNLSIKANNEHNHGERGIAGFVSKLYQSLQAPENGQKYAHWCRHKDKDMFVIDCIPRFTDEVLPRLFKHCKFPSFVRQLNIYGFQRDTDARKSKDTKDKETCRWHHPYFRPGRRDLFHLIRRKATQNSRRKRIQQVVKEEDPETIVNMDSGDDYSDNGGDILGLQLRRQSSVSSISNPASQHDISLPSCSSTLELLSNHNQHHQLHQDYQKQQQQQQLSQNIVYQQDSATDFDIVDPLMHHQHHQNLSSPPPPPSSSLCLETTLQSAMQQNMGKAEKKSLVTSEEAYTDDSAQNSRLHVNRFLQSDFRGASSSPSTFNDISKERHLQQQLCQLQTSYKNDRNYYTRQIHLAYSRIESQRAHIEQLEAISAQRHYQMQQQQHQNQQQRQQQHSGPFIKSEDATHVNNVYTPVTTLDCIVKTETAYDEIAFGKPESPSTALSPPNHLPTQSFYTQNNGCYTVTQATNGPSLPLCYGVNSQKPLPTPTSSSHHGNVVESRQSTLSQQEMK